jgi:chromosome segregation protein
MRLKKISIVGFKSFADKTVLNFDAGITCIVGPNGCGKSNISDAFRWVLGEQSAKSMRGAKMPDIIFAGSLHRKPLQYAEVSLTLTEINGSLPIEYEEVTVTRRLHRDGESEYLLNNNPVRLKDLQSLFLGSGVGKNAFSIFEQGKLDQVISSTPYERRYIFEEAAGILRFLQRKKETLKRLEEADLNFSRVKDIHTEVEKQMRLLEKQAEKARIYKEQRNLLEQLEKYSYASKWNTIQEKMRNLEQKQEQEKKNLEECQQKLLQSKDGLLELKENKKKLEESLRLHREKFFSMRNQKEMQERENQSLLQQVKEMTQRKKKHFLELEELHMAQQGRQKLLKELTSKCTEIESNWRNAEGQWMERQEIVTQEEKKVLSLRQQVSEKQELYVKQLQENNQIENEHKQIEIRIENGNELQKQLKVRFIKLQDDSKQIEQIAKEKKKQLLQMSGVIDHHKDRLDQFESEIKVLSSEIEAKHKELEILRKRTMELSARHEILLRMKEDLEGFSSGSKILLQESLNPKSPLYKTVRPLMELFSPEAEAIDAIAVVLRNYSQTLVVDSIADFNRILAFAKDKQLQEYSLVCKEWIEKQSLAMTKSSNKKNLSQKVAKNAFSQFFLEEIAIHEGDEQAIDAWRKESTAAWGLEGGYIDSKGVFFKMKSSENQVFLRESELQRVEEELQEQKDSLEDFESIFKQMQQRKTELQLERTELDKLLRRDEMKLVEINFGLQRAISDQEKNGEEQKNCQLELSTILENHEKQKHASDALQLRIREAKQKLEELQKIKDILQHDLEKKEEGLKEELHEQKERGIAHNEMAENRQQIKHECNVLEIKEKEHEKSVARLQDECGELDDKISVASEMQAKIGKYLLSCQEEVEKCGIENAELEKNAQSFEQQIEQQQHSFSQQEEKLKKIEISLSQSDLQSTHQQSAVENIEKELFEKFQLTIEEAKQATQDLQHSLDQTEKMIKGARRTLEECGDVNLTAIEDVEKQESRYQFLQQQLGDMQQSKDELLKIIADLDGESYKLFQETFDLIRTNFKKNFQILFNGGEADLQFTDSDDILEAGIEISARPPGKNMRSINLLSGGEKCLTAVALLFALFEVKPAPFCILDEIDAPLDDTNVERFLNVVKHFVDRCQFLIITHNKRTMAIGDVLFGVSMEERGVSKLMKLAFVDQHAPEIVSVTQ